MEATPPPSSSLAPTDLESGAERRWMLALSCVLVALPWLSVTYSPVTDLPQQLAQIRLFGDALTDPHSLYAVHWTTPNRLVYVLVGLCWLIAPLAWVGPLVMLGLSLLWVLSHHWLAQVFRLPSAAALLACLFVFNSSVYWGLLNFLCGWPVCVVWLVWTHTLTQRDENSWRDAFFTLVLAVVLFLAHALWLAAALLWWGLLALRHWRQWRDTLRHGVALLPVIAWAFVWRFTTMKDSIYAHGGAAWDKNPLQKLEPETLYTFGMGHLNSPVALSVFALFLLGVVAGVILRRREILAPERRVLLAAGLFFLVLYLFLPRRFNNTVEFDRRWLAPSLALFALALPLWLKNKLAQRAWAITLVGTFCVLTALTWRHFEQHALHGLKTSLAAIPHGAKVMELDFIKTHPQIQGRPFMHKAAYSQVYHGGRLNFSFATFPTLLVQYKEAKRPPWVIGLEWRAERIFARHQGQWLVRVRSMLFFDYLVLHAKPRMHRMFARLPLLKPVTPAAPWRLYKVQAPSAPASRSLPQRKPSRPRSQPPQR